MVGRWSEVDLRIKRFLAFLLNLSGFLARRRREKIVVILGRKRKENVFFEGFRRCKVSILCRKHLRLFLFVRFLCELAGFSVHLFRVC